MVFLWIVPAIVVVVIAFALIVAMRSAGRLRDRSLVPTVSENIRAPHTTPLANAARKRYAAEWEALELRFPHAPSETLRDAERLIGSIMRDCGYPYLDPAQRPDALAEREPESVEDYRAARAVLQRVDDGTRVPQEEMRGALARYGVVVDTLLDQEIERQIDETM